MKELVLIAAIWYKDLETMVFLPKNINKGVIISGYRHAHCINLLKTISGLRSVKFGPDSVGESIQGFLTNKDRFVDRLEAMDIAIKAGQVEKENLGNPRIGLFSEDLY